MFMLLIVIADLILTFCPFGRLGAYDRLGRNLTGLIGAILPAAYGVVQYGTGVLLLGLGIRNHLFAVTFTCSAPSISLGGEPQEL